MNENPLLAANRRPIQPKGIHDDMASFSMCTKLYLEKIKLQMM